jgi:hypothetical protein
LAQRAAEVEQLAARTEQRAGAIADAEQRMARLDTLVAAMRGALEQLKSEQVLADRAGELSNRLALQVREAEGLVAALAKERELAARRA